jgi:hypothetical protein
MNIRYDGSNYKIINNRVMLDDSSIEYTVINSKEALELHTKDGACRELFINFDDAYIEGKKDNYIFISKCIFNKKSSLSNCRIGDTIFVEDSNIANSEFASFGKANTIEKDNNNFKHQSNVVFRKNVVFYYEIKATKHHMMYSIGVSNISDKYFNVFEFHGIARFLGVSFKGDNDLLLDGSKNSSLLFYDCSFENKFKIRNIEVDGYKNQQITKTNLNTLKIINCTVYKDSYLRLGFLKVDNFEIENLRNPQNAELNIGDCHFKNFTLSNFRNIGKFKLFKINTLKITDFIDETKDNESFQIDNTSIGDADFQSVNLSSFNTLTLFDNIFDNVKYTNIKWGDFGDKKDIEVAQFNGDDNYKLEKQQDTYRTLKNVATANNDQPQAIKFYAKEMFNYRAMVKNNATYSKSDRLTLWFNYWSNNFGLNWGLQFISLVIFSIIMYGLLLFSLDCYCQDSIIFSKFFEFLNPTHKTEFVAKGVWSFTTYTIDFTFRIIEGLMIYQTIQAFRKYSRKL